MYVALHEVTWHGAWLYDVHGTRRDGSSFTWHQPRNNQTVFKNTTSVNIQNALYKKIVTHASRLIKGEGLNISLETNFTCVNSAVSMLESGQYRYIKTTTTNNNSNNNIVHGMKIN